MGMFGNLFQRKALTSAPSSGRGWLRIAESFGGAWQTGTELQTPDLLAQGTVFACIKLIAEDIAKLPVGISENREGIWTITPSAFDALLRMPNTYQNRAQFFNAWIVSKLLEGNTYVLKVRDASGWIVGLKLLDPRKVKVLVGEDDSVFYQISGGTGLQPSGDSVPIPAREIIHDRGICLHHPLVGVSPLTAAAMGASQGVAIQRASSTFFGNGARPSGVLTAPAEISEGTAARLKTHWQESYTGSNAGKVAVLGDGLQWQALTMSALDSQLLEQLQFTDRQICTAFGVPAGSATFFL